MTKKKIKSYGVLLLFFLSLFGVSFFLLMFVIAEERMNPPKVWVWIEKVILYSLTLSSVGIVIMSLLIVIFVLKYKKNNIKVDSKK